MDQYHVLELIGEGQFGKVYRGRRRFTGRMVALKFIGKKGKSDRDLQALRQEMHILSTLTDCPYIIRLLDWFETSTELCVVTEYAQGELFQILEDDQSLPEDRVREIAIQLVAGLRFLHAHRIIHRDLKPQNILIDAEGGVKLCDFGFARSLSANTSLLTSVKGTPLYMAPELVRSMPYNHTTDLWSLGVILYELAVGTPPFFTNSFYTLVHLIVDSPVQYPSGMSENFKSFLQGLLHKTPSKRLGWPDLLNHPFIKETEEEERTRLEKIARRKATVTASAVVAGGGVATPRMEDGPAARGLGGAAMPPKPQTAMPAAAQPPRHPPAKPAATKVVSQTARPAASNSNAAASSAAAAAAQAALPARPAVAVPPSNGTRPSPSPPPASSTSSRPSSRPSSADPISFDLHQLSTLLSPSHVSTLLSTLHQLTAYLQQAAASPVLPSPLLDIYPLLLSERVPHQLCTLLRVARAGGYGSSLSYEQVLPVVVQALACMVQPEAGKVAPMPLDGAGSDGTTASGGGGSAGGGGGGGGGAMARAGVGRAPPNFEVQLRRQLAECLMDTSILEKAPRAAATNSMPSAYQLLSAACRSAAKDPAPALSSRSSPSPLLSSLVILFFQCARSCPAPTPSKSKDPHPSPSSGLLESLTKDVELLAALLQALHQVTASLPADELSDRSRLAGRLLLLFATLCGKHAPLVKLLVTRCGFDPAHVLVDWLDHPNPLVSLPAAFLLAQLVTNQHAKLENHVRNPVPLLQTIMTVMQRTSCGGGGGGAAQNGTAHGSSSSFFTSSPTTLMCELEGSGVGYSLLGSHDGLVQLLQALLYFHSLQLSTPSVNLIDREAQPTSERFLLNEVWMGLMKRLERLEATLLPSTQAMHANAELSVLGWMSFLSLLLELLKLHAKLTSIPSRPSSHLPPPGSLLTDVLFRGLCGLLSSSRVSALYSWPEALGGGSGGVALLLRRLINVLYIPFTTLTPDTSANQPAGYDPNIPARAQKLLFNLGVVRRLLYACRLLELPLELEMPLGFLAQLTIRSPHFARQVVDGGVLGLMSLKQLLNPQPRVLITGGEAGEGAGIKQTVAPSPALLTDGLLMLSQLARSSADHYPAIHAANLYADLRSLLTHPDAGVRAKTCNVLGNLCRHSSYFYPHLLRHHLLPTLMERCSDSAPAVRKWAAFALGNAVFHDASLCATVSQAIPALLTLMQAEGGKGGGSSSDDPSEKTRQNAAGVLTNLLRHNVAAEEMIHQGAVPVLAQLLFQACESSAPPSAALLQCARSVLFTLGHLAAFPAAKTILQQQGILQRIQHIQHTTKDAKLQSYCQRLFTRYQAN